MKGKDYQASVSDELELIAAVEGQKEDTNILAGAGKYSPVVGKHINVILARLLRRTALTDGRTDRMQPKGWQAAG